MFFDYLNDTIFSYILSTCCCLQPFKVKSEKKHNNFNKNARRNCITNHYVLHYQKNKHTTFNQTRPDQTVNRTVYQPTNQPRRHFNITIHYVQGIESTASRISGKRRIFYFSYSLLPFPFRCLNTSSRVAYITYKQQTRKRRIDIICNLY